MSKGPFQAKQIFAACIAFHSDGEILEAAADTGGGGINREDSAGPAAAAAGIGGGGALETSNADNVWTAVSFERVAILANALAANMSAFFG